MVATVRVRGKSWERKLRGKPASPIAKQRLEDLFGSQKAGIVEGEALGERFFRGDSRPGCVSHCLQDPVRCRGCGQLVSELYQNLDGVKIGDPLCRSCSDAELNPRPRGERSRRKTQRERDL